MTLFWVKGTLIWNMLRYLKNDDFWLVLFFSEIDRASGLNWSVVFIFREHQVDTYWVPLIFQKSKFHIVDNDMAFWIQKYQWVSVCIHLVLSGYGDYNRWHGILTFEISVGLGIYPLGALGIWKLYPSSIHLLFWMFSVKNRKTWLKCSLNSKTEVTFLCVIYFSFKKKRFFK